MKTPLGLNLISNVDLTNKVYKLKRSLYGFKQAPRKTLLTMFFDVGCIQCKANYLAFIFKQGDIHVIILIYVNDILIVGNDMITINFLKQKL
jgi:hypothetical protein